MRRQPQHQQSQQHQRQKSFSKRSWLSGSAGEKKELVGCRREKRLCLRDRERTHVGVLGLTYPFQYGHFLPQRLIKEKRQTLYSLKGRWNQWGTNTGASTPICSWSRNRTGVQSCHQLKGPELIYKETNFHDGNIERRFSEHQEMRLCGYNVRDSLLMKRAIEPVREDHRGFYSNLFLAKKQDGVQICHQLKGPELIYKETNFNDGNVERRISENQEKRLGGYNRPQGRLPSRAYCEGHRRFIGFWWQGRSFQFRRLPFSSAPRTFTTISLPVVGMCRAKGIRLIAYLDDFLVLARNWRQLISHTSTVLDILDQAGFRRNLKKCHLQPRQKFKYLCLQWDSKELRVMLPADKITRFLSIKISIESPSEDGSNISRQLLNLGRIHLRSLQIQVKKGIG